MFPTSLQHPYAPRGRRRGRNDPNSRDYICPCGKSYLSYPALFTHIKIKHNGRAPGQIIKPKSENPSKRGRPRQKQVYDSDSDTNDMAANCIDRLCDFVTEFQKPQQQQLISRLKELYMKDPFYRVYVNYNPQEIQPRYNERDDMYEQYCDNVFCEMIAEVNKRLNQPYYVDLVMVVFMLMAHFIDEQNSGENIVQDRHQGEYGYGDQYGAGDEEEYVQENENDSQNEGDNNQNGIVQEEQYQQESQQQQNPTKKIPQQDDQPINDSHMALQPQAKSLSQQLVINDEQETFIKLKQQPIRNIVNYINGFILNYEQKYYQTFHLEEFSFFQQQNLKIFIELFFNWLTMKKYIAYKVKMNKNYQ